MLACESRCPSRTEMLRYYLVSSTFLAMIGFLFYRDLVFILVLAGFSYPLRTSYIRYLSEQKKKVLSSQFRDLLYSLSASISTGRSMQEALREADYSMRQIYQNDSPLCKELDIMIRRLEENGEKEDELLRDFALRCGIDEIKSFADIYATARRTGGDLIGILSKTAQILLDKGEIQKEIQKLTAQKRLEARIITIMPCFLILFLKISSPEYLSVMYGTMAGRILMTIALLLLCFSYYLAIKLCQIEP